MEYQLQIFDEPKVIGEAPPEKKYCVQKNDEKDITRIRILDECYRRLYFMLKPKYNEVKRGIFIFYHDELQAEIEGTSDLSIRERLFIHIKAIREIKKIYK